MTTSISEVRTPSRWRADSIFFWRTSIRPSMHLLPRADVLPGGRGRDEQETGKRYAEEHRAGKRAGSEAGAHPSKSFVRGSAVPAGGRRPV